MPIVKKTGLDRKALLIGLAIAVLVGGGLFAFVRTRDKEPVGSNGVNMTPPSEEEKKAADDQKDENIKRQEAETPTGKKTVTPTIVDASQYDQQIEVRAFVSGIYEDGTCTFTFTNGSNTVTKTSAGVKDATTIRCTNLSVPRSEFPVAGQWSLVVSYNSATSSGSSVAKSVEVM